MTLKEITLVIGMMVPVVGAAGTGAKLYGDRYWWVSAEAYNENELDKLTSKKRLLEFDKNNGTLTPRGQLELNELKDLEKKLLLKMQ